MTTQTTAILRHLKARKTITPLSALKQFGCLRLGARIHDLRKNGVSIATKRVTTKGKTYAEYRLG